MSQAMMERTSRRRAKRIFGNDNDAFIPELWARYTIAILEKYMVAGRLVARDFESTLANFGDTVNTRKPSAGSWDRKSDDDDIVTHDVTATNIAVKLNMHPYTSFIIKDGESTLSMEKLVERHLDGHVKAMAEGIDACVTGQYVQFLANAGCGGSLGGLTNANYQQYLAETVERLDTSNCPQDGRQILVTPATKKLILQNQPLVGANQRGDGGNALETADMGMIYGVQHYMTQSMRSVLASDITSSAFLVNTSALQTGDTVVAIDTGTGALATGQWLTILGKPYRITAHTETLGNTTSITVSPALREVVANNTPITVYDPGLVDLVGGYAAGWSKAIVYDGTTITPKVGQGLTFGTDTDIYTIVQVTSTKMWLDRALEAAITDDEAINLMPPGGYNMVFRKPAIMLVCRPLEAPRPGTGAISTVIEHAGFPLRIVIAYDYKKQGHAVTIDNLMGIKVLEPEQGAVLLS